MEQQTRQSRAAARKKRRMLQRQQMCRLMGYLLIAGILVTSVLNLFTKDKDFSASENRMLAGRPDLSVAAIVDGSYMSGLEDYQADQFFGRDGWISLKLKIDRFFGKKEASGVYLADDNYLMEIPVEPNYESVQRNLSAITDFAARYPELNIKMMVVPNAVSVMAGYLPKNAPVRDQMADLQMIKDGLPANVGFIDVTQTLMDHVDEGMFYRTDHHWTSRGAYYAFLDASDDLGITQLKEYNRYAVTTQFEGTLGSKSGCHAVRDTIEVYEPLNPGSSFYVTYDETQEKSCSLFRSACLEDKDQYTVFFGGNYPRITIRTTNNNDRSLLIFKDSYANCFVQFLTPYYEEIVLVDPRYYYDDAGALISTEKVTDVLFLYNLSTYMGDTSLADTLEAAQKPEMATAAPADGETADGETADGETTEEETTQEA